MTKPLRLLVFRREPELVRRDLEAGIDGVVVDWEHQGKAERQAGWDTEIRPSGDGELRAIAAAAGAGTWCRINGPGNGTPAEVERAIESGAAGILLPMVKSVTEVEALLRAIDGRVRAGILVETPEAQGCARELARFPLDLVYFGLNDFAIARGSRSIFEALADGSVEATREAFRDRPFGFGGLTAIDSGSPIPCRRLLEELSRLGCDFTFLRRSFHRDSRSRSGAGIVAGLRQAWEECGRRDEAAIARDAALLRRSIRESVAVAEPR